MVFNEHDAPEWAVLLSDDERERLAQLMGNDQVSVLDFINEDRGLKL